VGGNNRGLRKTATQGASLLMLLAKYYMSSQTEDNMGGTFGSCGKEEEINGKI
jgi:hypothetical protein